MRVLVKRKYFTSCQKTSVAHNYVQIVEKASENLKIS